MASFMPPDNSYTTSEDFARRKSTENNRAISDQAPFSLRANVRFSPVRHFGAALLGYVKLPPDPGVVTMPQLRMAGFAPRLPDDFRPGAQRPILIPGNGE
jgi:hypothetical protein